MAEVALDVLGLQVSINDPANTGYCYHQPLLVQPIGNKKYSSTQISHGQRVGNSFGKWQVETIS
jgi:hypothetical protein